MGILLLSFDLGPSKVLSWVTTCCLTAFLRDSVGIKGMCVDSEALDGDPITQCLSPFTVFLFSFIVSD